MDSSTGALGDGWRNRWRNHKEGLFANIIAAILCLMLLLLSLILVNINSHAANADNTPSSLSVKQSPTPTVTSTTTAIPSPTPSPTATFTPSPTVKPTKTPRATPSPGVTATATRPSTTATPSPGATTTATMTLSPVATASPTGIGNQTPSPISGLPTTTNGGGNSNGGGNGNGRPPALSQGGLFGLSLSSFIIGSLILLGIVGAILLSLVLLRKRLLPNPSPQVNLPPSGAQPWKRVRTESLNGISNVPGEEYFSPGSNIQGVTFQSDGSGLPVPGMGYASNAPLDGTRQVVWEAKPLTRHIPPSIRLQAMESSGSQPTAYELQQQDLDRK